MSKARNLGNRANDIVSVRDFGAVGDGSADDTAAIQATLNSGAKNIYFPSGNYKITNTLILPSVNGLRIVQAGTLSAVITKHFSGPAVIWNSGEAVWENCCINGQGNIYAGSSEVGILVPTGGGFSSKLVNPRIYNTGSACIRFVPDSGSAFTVIGGLLEPTPVNQAAIDHTNVADTVPTARKFIGIQSGGRLIDFANMETTIVTACNTNYIVYDSTTKKAIVTGCRISSGGVAINLNGVDNLLTGNVIAGNVDVSASASNSTVMDNVFASGFGVTNTGGIASMYLQRTNASYVPQWTSSGTQPTLGDGTISGSYDQNGRQIHAFGVLTIGSTSTFGTGTYRFSLPFTNATGIRIGTARILDAGTAFYIGVAVVGVGANYVEITTNASASQVNPTIPMTWAAGDTLLWDIIYEC